MIVCMHDVGSYIPLCRSLTSLPGSPRAGNKIRIVSSSFPSFVPNALLGLGTWPSVFLCSISPQALDQLWCRLGGGGSSFPECADSVVNIGNLTPTEMSGMIGDVHSCR